MAVIKQVATGGTIYDIVAKKPFYGTCSTAAATTAKVVDCADFTSDDLIAGAVIVVKNTTANTGSISSLTMNVNSTGAKSIKKIYNSVLNSLTTANEFGAYTMTFIYDGTNWVLQNVNIDTKVTQVVTTTNATYPLLFTTSSSQSTTSTSTVRFGTLINANPSLGRVAMQALVVGQSTTANYSGWTTTVPSSTTNAQTGQVMFVVES